MGFDVFKLRPTASTSTAIQEALDRTTAAHTEQAAALRQAKAARDAQLLDGTAASLKQAEADVAAAMDTTERISTILAELEKRLAAAVEREVIEAIEAARLHVEAKRAAEAEWWAGFRDTLASELTVGLQLRNDSTNAYHEWQRRTRRANERDPDLEFAHPAVPENAPGNWPYDVGTAGHTENFRWLASNPKAE